MFGLVRRMSLAIPLVLAVVVPYALLSDSTSSIRQKVSSWIPGRKSDLAQAGSFDPVTGQWVAGPEAHSDTVPVLDLRQVFRFDITPRWVLSRWPHVATTHAGRKLDGLRIPLVTGTQPYDVAGSLTYYFDEQRVLQRIALQGVTGDDRFLVSIMTRDFHLTPAPRAGAGVFVAKWNGKPTSALLVRRRPVVRAEQAHQKYEVAVELNRPDYYFGLSPEFQQLLQSTQAQRVPSSTRR